MSGAPAAVLAFALLSGTLLTLLMAALIAAFERAIMRQMQPMPPTRRVRLLSGLLAAPAVSGAAYAALTLTTPWLAQPGARFASVCEGHVDELWHACLWHPTATDGNGLLATALLLLASAAVVAGLRILIGAWRSRQAIDTLLRLAEPRDGALVIDCDRPLAMTCGFRGHVLLSRCLIERLQPRQLRIVLAHERAHVAHRDVLRHSIARVLSLVQLPGTGRRLLAGLILASEQRCDRIAADVDGSALTVAETIVAVERLFGRRTDETTLPHSAGFANGFVQERVHALLAAPAGVSPRLGLLLAVSALLVCLLSGGGLHHVTEFLLVGMLT